MSTIYTSMDQLIGGTPLLELSRIEKEENLTARLLAKLEYAQEHDMRNEQRRVFKEMKTLAENTDYSEYQEENSMLKAVRMLRMNYGY